MSIQEISVLILFTLILGAVARRWQRGNLLMVSSIMLLYWLQPESSLRFAGFWLITTALLLTILSWIFTADPSRRLQADTFQALALIALTILAASAIRFLDSRNTLELVNSPPLTHIIPLILAGSLLSALLSLRGPRSSAWTWLILGLIISLFIIIKTPSLAFLASRTWRMLAGQSLKLAGPDEIRWLGFSYLAFRLLHTIRDRQAGRLPDVSLREYLSYVVFYPSFVSGPIAQIDQVVSDIRQFSGSYQEHFIRGAERIIRGMFRKFVIADSLAIISLSDLNANLPATALGAWVILYAYGLQIYFDFSGYSDIAIGLGGILGIRLPENFNQPYLKPNLTQFWNNWHMSLTNWFRSYFFNPLSRNLRRKKLPVPAILALTQIPTMILVGLWHGITPNFGIWGIWHGLGLLAQNRWSAFAVHRFPQDEGNAVKKLLDKVGVLLTFHYVTLGWIWFVLPIPEQGWRFLLSLFGAS